MNLIRYFLLCFGISICATASHAQTIQPNCTLSKNTYICSANSSRITTKFNCAQDLDKTITTINSTHPICVQTVRTLVQNWIKIRATAGTNAAGANAVYKNYVAAHNRLNQLMPYFGGYGRSCASVSYTPIRAACGAGPQEGGSFEIP